MQTLLYVDDSWPRLQVVSARLRDSGYRVLTADNGAHALEIFAKQFVNLAVVDYYMQGMGGDLVALEMKRLQPDVPVIIFSGTFKLPEFVIALVDGFVFTGDDPEKLTARIADVLREHSRKTGNEEARRASGAA